LYCEEKKLKESRTREELGLPFREYCEVIEKKVQGKKKKLLVLQKGINFESLQ